MTTIVLSENRKMGVTWLEENFPGQPTDLRRTQTEVLRQNNDRAVVVVKEEHIPVGNFGRDDALVVIGAVNASLTNSIIAKYKQKGYTITPVFTAGAVALTSQELRRLALRQELEDLDKEETLIASLTALAVAGVTFKKPVVQRGGARTFSIRIDGHFD